jgi:hypothetical protein
METPPVLLIDDGELDEVRGLLEDLAVDFLHVRGPSVPDEVEEPACLLVTTAGRALTLQLMQPDDPRSQPGSPRGSSPSLPPSALPGAREEGSNASRTGLRGQLPHRVEEKEGDAPRALR